MPPALPPRAYRQSTTPPSEAAERASRLSREIEAVTLSSRPARGTHPSGAEIDVDDLDLDFGEPDVYAASSVNDALPPSNAVPPSRGVPPTGAPLSDAVPRPAQLRPAAPSGVDLQDYTRQALQAANMHRAQGQFDRAIEVLHDALEGHPRSIELRETLRDLHAERGDRESAIEEMLTMAAIYLEYGRADHATTVLRNILEAEPTHPRALVALAGVRAMSGTAPRAAQKGSRGVTASPRAAQTPALPQVHDAFLAASVEEALEESEFFSSRGMLGDARRVLVDQLAQTPNHPLLLEALAEVDKQAPKQRPASKPATKRPTDFNIKEQLNELERAVRESQKPPSMSNGPASIDVDAVFEKFKAGVRSQVAESDSSTHYDLGLAYKEMNLLEDAIEELKLAARDSERECTCYAMIGLIYAEQKSWDQARKFYSKGLGAMKRTQMQDTALYYELGHVSEMADQMDQAAYYFRQVLRRDPTFRDARKRLSSLRTSWAPPAEARSGSPDEEVDRAFDELINDG
jgi:tetratricopeptide (TPR) repeat protein